MMRREVFKAAPLLALPALLATDSAAGNIEEQTPCGRIFHIWDMERNRINGPEGAAMTEEEYNEFVREFDRLGSLIECAPAENARDVMLKVIVLSDYGCLGLPTREASPELWVEVDRFAGLQ